MISIFEYILLEHHITKDAKHLNLNIYIFLTNKSHMDRGSISNIHSHSIEILHNYIIIK